MKKLAIWILGAWLAMFGVALSQTALFSHAGISGSGVSLVVEANPGHVLAYFNCTGISGGAAGYCIAYNGSTVPGTGSLTAANVIDACPFGTGNAGCMINYTPGGIEFSTGIVILISSASTPFTYTTGTDTGFISANYN